MIRHDEAEDALALAAQNFEPLAICNKLHKILKFYNICICNFEMTPISCFFIYFSRNIFNALSGKNNENGN